MKKVLLITLVVAMLFSLSSCIEVVEGVPQEEYDALKEKYDAVVAERDALLNGWLIENTEITTAPEITHSPELETTIASESTNEAKTTSVPETTGSVEKNNLLYEDEKIKVTYRKVEKIRYVEDSIEIHMYIENKTDATLIIQADVISLNGYSFSDPTMSDNILAHTTGKAIAIITTFDFDAVDINNIFSVGGQLRVYEEDFQNVYTAIFNDIQVN